MSIIPYVRPPSIHFSICPISFPPFSGDCPPPGQCLQYLVVELFGEVKAQPSLINRIGGEGANRSVPSMDRDSLGLTRFWPNIGLDISETHSWELIWNSDGIDRPNQSNRGLTWSWEAKNSKRRCLQSQGKRAKSAS